MSKIKFTVAHNLDSKTVNPGEEIEVSEKTEAHLRGLADDGTPWITKDQRPLVEGATFPGEVNTNTAPVDEDN